MTCCYLQSIVSSLMKGTEPKDGISLSFIDCKRQGLARSSQLYL